MSTLPEGYLARPARLEEAAQLVVPAQLVGLRCAGEMEPSLEEFISDIQAPGLNLETDSLAVWAPDGVTCAGYVEVHCEVPHVRSMIWGATHPEHEGLGIGTYMVEWALARARELIPLADAEKMVVARGSTYGNDEDGLALLRDNGLEVVRHYFQMRIDMEEAPIVPPIPDGIAVRTMNLEQDLVPLYHAYDEAFRDHYGYIERPFEVGFARFKHHNSDNEWFNPDHVLIAEAVNPATGNLEIAGFSINYPDAADPEARGDLHMLGVRRPWRRRGLANYLLYRTFAVHWNRGAKTVILGVDASNPTGALELYQKAGMYEAVSGVALEMVLREGLPAFQEE